ncbi:MAG: hypothetical protein IPL58_11010 [Betaproteobacteria bacterium]|jgi:hypothetical protein|uniref:Uncharacterized protein n=1 Tax=Candidatus Proximibacter danicus TaxID=2954365 RepID=A0A9D7PRV8_9PROT|nr:hypothetical protein [Candidatus Proximibacter danicus]MBK9447052.1 hypothetical protein [Betaproteobacteria bacterium]
MAAVVLVLLTLGAIATLLDAARLRAGHATAQATQATLVSRFGLTDLSLFTEARYTRHRALADLHSPFQDHPFSLEHFPSGSLLPPPTHLTQARHEALDREAALPR